MNIAATDFTLKLNSFDIYVSGCCEPHCPGCHNPELFDFKYGDLCTDITISNLKKKIKLFDNLIKRIMIFGGEPLDQNINDLVHLLTELKDLNKEIWLFTKYTIDIVKEKKPIILDYLDYIKCGRYDRTKPSDDNYIQYGIKLASTNQKIYKLH